jgi:hypothetical protein
LALHCSGCRHYDRHDQSGDSRHENYKPNHHAGTGRIPYQYTPFIRSFLAKGYFGIEKASQLIQRLKGEPNLRLLCGCTHVPGKATFSRALPFLSA